MLEFFSFILIGLLAGIFSGLLGIGGGIITVPSLILIFSLSKLPSSDSIHLAIGTSLASMIFTTFASSYSHFRKQAVLLNIIKPMGIGIFIGTFLGALITKELPRDFLMKFFGFCEGLIGFYFIFFKKPRDKHLNVPNCWGLGFIGVAVSTISSMLGVGGGFFNVPILNYFGVPIKKAIGTSSALSFLISFFGSLSFLILGVFSSSTKNAIGFLYLPAFFTISLLSFFSAPYGAKIAHTIDTAILKKIFGIFLVISGFLIITN